MQFTVISDMHGNTYALKRLIGILPANSHIIFLGDGVAEAEQIMRNFPTVSFCAVRGNNDFYCDLPLWRTIEEDGCKILMTHGHYAYVKSGLFTLADKARNEGAKVVLFGHTHRQFCEERDGVLFLNPGALYNSRPTDDGRGIVYATLTVENGKASAVLHP